MIRIRNLTLPLEAGMEQLQKKAARELGISPASIHQLVPVRQSIDARKKHDVHFVYTVDVTVPEEEHLVNRLQKSHITLQEDKGDYQFPKPDRQSDMPPVIVGMGPAGLFAAWSLAQAGIPSIILERGEDVDTRAVQVEKFWESGQLSARSNVQFGEGGAGTFSDGKLTTGTHDPRARAVLQTLVSLGAPQDVMWSHKPHIGTDVLRQVVKNMREELRRLHCDIRFGHQLTDIRRQGGRVSGVTVTTEENVYDLPCDTLILAPGHSARDTFALLQKREVPMAQKPFAIGVRIEHQQEAVSRAQFGDAWEKLPPTDYKLACHLPSGRSAFTFCVCPGGEVVAAASAPGQVVTNGMSRRARDGENINGGFLVGVGPADYPGEDPLAGVRFQETWERAAWEAGGRSYRAPAQLVGDFLDRRPSRQGGAIRPTYRPGVTWTELETCLPPYVLETLREALPIFHQKIAGFADPQAVLTGVETRSSSPVRILRDSVTFQSALSGLYPCGEGAGYAGGIVSAAVDGIRVAEAVALHDGAYDPSEQ